MLSGTYRNKAAFAIIAGPAPTALAAVLLGDANLRLVLFSSQLGEEGRLWLWLDAYARPPSVHCLSVVIFFLDDIFHDVEIFMMQILEKRTYLFSLHYSTFLNFE